MSETKWTPGPWVQFIDRERALVLIMPAMRPGEIAQVDIAPAAGEANARLIVAAPEMYEALRDIYNTVNSLLIAPERLDRIRERAGVILGKIEGRTP